MVSLPTELHWEKKKDQKTQSVGENIDRQQLCSER